MGLGQIARRVLEFKVNWLSGSQIFLPFPPFRLEEDFSQRYFHKIVQTSGSPENVQRYLCSLDVVLCNN